jgi:hypothetical protein
LVSFTGSPSIPSLDIISLGEFEPAHDFFDLCGELTYFVAFGLQSIRIIGTKGELGVKAKFFLILNGRAIAYWSGIVVDCLGCLKKAA